MVTPYFDGGRPFVVPHAQAIPHTYTGGSNRFHVLHPSWGARLSTVPTGDPDFSPVRVACHLLFPWASPGDVIVADATSVPQVGDPVTVALTDGGLIVARLRGYSDDFAAFEPVTGSDVGLCLPRYQINVVRPVVFVLRRRWVPAAQEVQS